MEFLIMLKIPYWKILIYSSTIFIIMENAPQFPRTEIREVFFCPTAGAQQSVRKDNNRIMQYDYLVRHDGIISGFKKHFHGQPACIWLNHVWKRQSCTVRMLGTKKYYKWLILHVILWCRAILGIEFSSKLSVRLSIEYTHSGLNSIKMHLNRLKGSLSVP